MGRHNPMEYSTNKIWYKKLCYREPVYGPLACVPASAAKSVSADHAPPCRPQRQYQTASHQHPTADTSPAAQQGWSCHQPCAATSHSAPITPSTCTCVHCTCWSNTCSSTGWQFMMLQSNLRWQATLFAQQKRPDMAGGLSLEVWVSGHCEIL